MNYTELSDRIIAYTENPNLTGTLLDSFIDFAESEIYRDVDFKVARLYATTNLIASDHELTLPDDCYIVRYLQLLVGTVRTFLLPKDISFINEYWPDRTATGTPVFYAWKDDGKVWLAPTPAAANAMEMCYTTRPAPISSTNTTTYLGDRYPYLLFTGVMKQVMAYQKAEVAQLEGTPESPGFWEREYTKETQRVAREQMALQGSDMFYSGEPVLK